MWSLRSVAGCRRLGAAGSAGIALGGWAAGALPAGDSWGLWFPRAQDAARPGTLLALVGLTLLVVAWWRYGRLVAGGAAVPARAAAATLAWWAAPLLLAPPLYSADVYSYVAQGAMVVEGHDVYRHGPSVLAPDGIGGTAAASVGGHWTDTPAPYGPAFLLLAKAVAATAAGHIVPAVLGMRVVAVAALALVFWALLRFAPRRATAGALWLGALNPLLLVHVVGGLHNDGLTGGLLLAGTALAVRRGRWVAGSALVALAATVKSPAVLALLFIGVAVGREASGPLLRRVAKGLLGPGAVAARRRGRHDAVRRHRLRLAAHPGRRRDDPHRALPQQRPRRRPGRVHVPPVRRRAGARPTGRPGHGPDPGPRPRRLPRVVGGARPGWTRCTPWASPCSRWWRSPRWSSPGTCCGPCRRSPRPPGTAAPAAPSPSCRRASCT
ncbi:polyprenol phosphomannose-dependent alpha 1,6 mannosyltransferase MptB [Streptomyces somaliensis]|uniref:polyprenol phosphomannose-dependent alpha 1,6 mannosyltransferase MptB n=1 Tax=Streptomyces somaliensis TaxID=78355 RepID=UPI0034E93A69|nr:polyprenol phosphomannose-dependent alpha 1,6 mannosyltransferase MptB [Streptomyces somaliensis]